MICKRAFPLFIKCYTLKILALAFTLGLSVSNTKGQQTPLKPVSYRVFSPFVINPAIAGSKDFSTLDFAAQIQGDDMSQILSGNTRISKYSPGYFNSPVIKDYTNIGAGGYFFNDNIGTSHSTGIGISGSYHIPVTEDNLSFLSIGASLKGIYNRIDSISDLSLPAITTFIPNIDFGLYYYGPRLSAGISVTNVFGNPLDSTDMSNYSMPVSRQLFLTAGYRIMLSRPLDIVLEPSVLFNFHDTLDFGSDEMIEPMLKLYLSDFCVGAYMHDYDKLSFFFQYKFPGFYIGTFFDFPRNTAFYKSELAIELAVGINLTGLKPSLIKNWHW